MLGAVLLGVVAVVVVVIFLGSMKAGKATPKHGNPPAQPPGPPHVPQARPSTSSPGGLESLPDGGWLLTPGWTFDLSIRGVDRDTALEVKRLLDRTKEERPEQVYAPLARLIFDKGILVDQVEAFFKENGPKYREELKRLTAGQDADFVDDDTRRKALKVLDVWIPQEPWSLYEDAEPLTSADLEVVGRFGRDVLEVCLQGAAEPGQVEGMRPDDRRVPAYERLVAEGLAEPYPSIPPRDLLPVLHLDELRGMLKVAGGPPVKRKADAVAFLQDRDDLRVLLEGAGLDRGFYRFLPQGDRFAGSDLGRIRRHLPDSWAVAQLLADTYFATAAVFREVTQYGSSGVVEGVEVLTAGAFVCPCCQRMEGKRLTAQDSGPPFHLGCRCTILPVVSPSER